ncbi:hypothetical protein ACQEUV_01315 [Micromonospora aurantiaca (nom. illeg.)]|uniref:hypothetical protein n=1 Tax=Micromonospora aurantiaca (nom. illeg.) TaxID=47850 RepID=UPI002980A515|nr:hypothetical protein [Micromonospora aurantiaca]
MDDNALTRSLHRLTRSGLVRADSKHIGSRSIKTYGLSDKGREHLVIYEAMVAVYAHLQVPPDECDGTCPVHNQQAAHRAA